MNNHTPGPWEVSEDYGELFVQVVNQPASCHTMFDPYRIIHGYVGGDPTENPTPDLGTPEGNARLIAAAPELLEALQMMVRNSLRADWPEDIYSAMVDAIAKATGESA